MMHRRTRRRILLDHTCIHQDTVLPLLHARSTARTKISLLVLPTAATPTPQSDLMAWRAAVICTERRTDIEYYSVCCEDLADGNIMEDKDEFWS
jgi:hypothetical protein